MNYFITAIGTDSGKTLFSAILAYSLKADYWKPIQAGTPTDTETIKKLVGNSVFCHPEAYRLAMPASPHAAASKENIFIKLNDLRIPETDKALVIEGAGGVLVPLNDDEFVIDIASKTNAEIIVVSNNYLGSINHTLLTLNYLESKGYKIRGLVFNGEENKDTEDIIMHHAKCPCILRIPKIKSISKENITQLASQINL